jgi:hypothetical protein
LQQGLGDAFAIDVKVAAVNAGGHGALAKCVNEQYREGLGGGGSGDQQRDRDPGCDQFEHHVHGGEVPRFGVLDEFADERHTCVDTVTLSRIHFCGIAS